MKKLMTKSQLYVTPSVHVGRVHVNQYMWSAVPADVLRDYIREDNSGKISYFALHEFLLLLTSK